MTLQEAMTWIELQRSHDAARISVMLMPGGQVWLSSSTGATALVMNSSDEGARNRMYVDLQEYIRLTMREAVAS